MQYKIIVIAAIVSNIEGALLDGRLQRRPGTREAGTHCTHDPDVQRMRARPIFARTQEDETKTNTEQTNATSSALCFCNAAIVRNSEVALHSSPKHNSDNWWNEATQCPLQRAEREVWREKWRTMSTIHQASPNMERTTKGLGGIRCQEGEDFVFFQRYNSFADALSPSWHALLLKARV